MYVSRPRPTFLYLRESISKYKGTKDLLLLRLLSQISNGSQDFFYGMFLVPALQNGAFGFYKSVYRLPYPFRVLILPSDFNYIPVGYLQKITVIFVLESELYLSTKSTTYFVTLTSFVCMLIAYVEVMFIFV